MDDQANMETQTGSTATGDVTAAAAQIAPTLEEIEAKHNNSPISRELFAEIEAKRNAENLDRAKAGGYVEPTEPSISERVGALIAGVQHAMDHNSPISRELFAEMKALLGYRETPAPAQSEA